MKIVYHNNPQQQKHQHRAPVKIYIYNCVNYVHHLKKETFKYFHLITRCNKNQIGKSINYVYFITFFEDRFLKLDLPCQDIELLFVHKDNKECANEDHRS